VMVYALCATRPALVRRAVTAAVPHPLTMLQLLGTPAQLARSWYMGLFQLPGAGWIAGARDLALVDRLWRTWSPGVQLPDAARAALHACLARSLPAPIGYYRALVRPLRTFAARRRVLAVPIPTPLLQLHGQQDGCIAPVPEEMDRRWFAARDHRVVPNAG